MLEKDKERIENRAYRALGAACRMAEKDPDYDISSRLEEINLHHAGYAEPGYTDPECGLIATGNWNTIDRYDRETQQHTLVSDLPERLCRIFEKLGVEIEWSDEWHSCDECSKLVRTSPDSYGWKPSYTLSDDGLVCHECLQSDPESYLKALEGKHRECGTIESIDPGEHGYVRFEQGESGWHPGQTDNPAEYAARLKLMGIHRYLFNLDQVGQFDQKWSCWIHESEDHKLKASK